MHVFMLVMDLALYHYEEKVKNLLFLPGNHLQNSIHQKKQLENWFVNSDNNIGIITGEYLLFLQ